MGDWGIFLVLGGFWSLGIVFKSGLVFFGEGIIEWVGVRIVFFIVRRLIPPLFFGLWIGLEFFGGWDWSLALYCMVFSSYRSNQINFKEQLQETKKSIIYFLTLEVYFII